MYYRYHTSVLIWVYHSTHASFFPYMGDTKFYSKLCGGYASPNSCFKTANVNKEKPHGMERRSSSKVDKSPQYIVRRIWSYVKTDEGGG